LNKRLVKGRLVKTFHETISPELFCEASWK
jgi:hypothetical protein